MTVAIIVLVTISVLMAILMEIFPKYLASHQKLDEMKIDRIYKLMFGILVVSIIGAVILFLNR